MQLEQGYDFALMLSALPVLRTALLILMGFLLFTLMLASSVRAQPSETPRPSARAWSQAELTQRRFDEVIDVIVRNFVNPVEEGILIGACLRSVPGAARSTARSDALAALSKLQDADLDAALDRCFSAMAGQLDSNSEYINEADFRIVRAGSQLPGAIGLRLHHTPNGVAVVDTIEGTPSEGAGFKRGDLVVTIDGQDVSRRPMKEIPNLLRGAPGSNVVVGVRRSTDLLHISVKREVVKEVPVFSRLSAPEVAYVSVTQFNIWTIEELLRTLTTLRQTSSGAIKGLIFDLRWSSGGLLDTAIALSALFLEGDLVVMDFRGKTATNNRLYRSRPADYSLNREMVVRLRDQFPEMRTVPIVVLVGRETASGAEVVAAALQDHGRAAIVGEPTQARGSAAAIFPLLWRTGLKITTGRMHRPSGESIDGTGVKPDFLVPATSALSADSLPSATPRTAVRGLLEDPAVARAVQMLSQR